MYWILLTTDNVLFKDFAVPKSRSKRSYHSGERETPPGPAQRVLEYLEAEFSRADLPDGCRLPSMRRLAERLRVSTATVHGVFQKLAEEGRIRTRPGSGSFLVARRDAGTIFRIGLNIPIPEAPRATWCDQIYGGILRGLLEDPSLAAVQALTGEALRGGDLRVDFARATRGLDGFILFPAGAGAPLGRLADEDGRPVVHVDPPEGATADFVSPDYFGASRRLAKVWEATGRRRIALYMRPSPDESVSARLRCGGFLAGLAGSLGGAVTARIFTVEEPDADSAFEHLRHLLESGEYRPDAVYCAGDDLALGAVRAFEACGVRVPEEASVVGGHGLGARA